MKHPIIIVLVVLLMLTVVACDQGASLQDAIARAIAKTSEVQSYRSAGNSTSHTDGVTTVSSYELECAAPDRYHSVSTLIVDDAGNVTTTTTVDHGNLTCISSATTSGGWFETIVVGDKGYVRS